MVSATRLLRAQESLKSKRLNELTTPPCLCPALDMAGDGVINSKGDETMYIVLNEEDFRKDKKGMSFFYYILNNLQIPIEKRDDVRGVEIQVKSFEVFNGKGD